MCREAVRSKKSHPEKICVGVPLLVWLSFGQASELSVPFDWESLEEVVELEVGRLSAFEDSVDKGR